MAAGYSAAANVGELIPEITERVIYIYQDRAIGPALTNFRDVSNIAGTVVEFPRFTEVTGSTSVAETGTPSSHQMDLSMPSLTIARRSVYVLLSDLAVKGATGDLVGQVSEAIAMAQAKQDDVQIFGVTTGTTNYSTSAGATNTALGIADALSALNQLELNEVNEVINCVVHPFQYKTIRSALTPVANDDGVAVALASDMARNAFVSRAFGMNWFVTNRVSSATVGATANVYCGLVFVRSALGYAFSWGAQAGIELDRSAPTASTGLVLNYFDKAGILFGEGVCELQGTST